MTLKLMILNPSSIAHPPHWDSFWSALTCQLGNLGLLFCSSLFCGFFCFICLFSSVVAFLVFTNELLVLELVMFVENALVKLELGSCLYYRLLRMVSIQNYIHKYLEYNTSTCLEGCTFVVASNC